MKNKLMILITFASISTFLHARPCKIVTDTSDLHMAFWKEGSGNDIEESAKKYGVIVVGEHSNMSRSYDYFIRSVHKVKGYTNIFGQKKVEVISEVVVVDRWGHEFLREEIERRDTISDEIKTEIEQLSFYRRIFGNHKGKAYRKAIKFIGTNLVCD